MNFEFIRECRLESDELQAMYDNVLQELERAEHYYWRKPQECGIILRQTTERICRIYNTYYQIGYPGNASLEEFLCYTDENEHNVMVSRFLSVVRKEQRDRLNKLRVLGDDCIWGDGQYAMPFNKSQMVLYYNVGMFEEAGIEVPTTWDEWAAAAEALTKDTDGDGEPDVYGIVFANNLSTDIAPWLKQAGGATMNEETNELYFDTPETKEAIEFLNGMFQNKTARFAGEDQNANVPLQQGRAAMCVASTSALPYIESDTMEGITIDAAALPGYKTDDQLYYGTNVTVYDVGTDAQKEASWLYLKFLTSTENTAYFAAQTGYIPVRKSAQNDPVFAAVLEEKPIKQLCFDCMDRGFQGTRNIGGINALDALGDQLDLVFSGEKDIDTALKDAQANGEKAMEEARNS